MLEKLGLTVLSWSACFQLQFGFPKELQQKLMLKGSRFTLMRRTAIARSAGVRNHAFVGESGKRNLASIAKYDKWHHSPVRDVIPKCQSSKDRQESSDYHEPGYFRMKHCIPDGGSVLTIAMVQNLSSWCARSQNWGSQRWSPLSYMRKLKHGNHARILPMPIIETVYVPLSNTWE